jgi:Mrp family chromosome partitioning ATPase
MPAGVRSDDNIVFEDIAKGSFLTCINKLRQRYQIILLDCAPILPLADAAIMSNHVDGTILVERELVSHRRDVAVAIERLNSAGARFLGFAFVGSVDCQKYGYESYYYNPYDRS